MDKTIAFLDIEINPQDQRILDIGAVRSDGAVYHAPSAVGLSAFLHGTAYICGHNIIHHDLSCLKRSLELEVLFSLPVIDTLYLSPLLFPGRVHHALPKDEKLMEDEQNNPVNDCRKSEQLFFDEVQAFDALPTFLKEIYGRLLSQRNEWEGFFAYLGYSRPDSPS